MKTTTLLAALALCLSSSNAQSQDTTMNVEQILSAYIPSIPISLAPSISTSLASAIASVASTWYESPQLTSLNSAILSAAPTADASSYATGGVPYGLVAEESWYKSAVPSDLQTVLSKQFDALESAEREVLAPYLTTSSARTMETGTSETTGAAPATTTTSTGRAGAVRTAAPALAALGAVGVMAFL